MNAHKLTHRNLGENIGQPAFDLWLMGENFLGIKAVVEIIEENTDALLAPVFACLCGLFVCTLGLARGEAPVLRHLPLSKTLAGLVRKHVHGGEWEG